jgi:O-antigen/teichoic acid export membrane protein
MDLKLQALRNVGSTWFGLGVNLAVGFFLSPFILHRLGDDAFGLWILVFSLTSYYGLFDLGIRSSVVKYVAEFTAVRDEDLLARMMNTSLFIYGCLGGLLMLITLVGCFYVGSVFHVSPTFRGTASLLFLMVGTALALGFPMSVFSGALEGLQKFHWINLVRVGQNLIRVVLIVAALKHGRGLLTIALITVTLPLLSYLVYVAATFRLIPFPLGWRFVDRAMIRRIAHFSSSTFLMMMAGQLRFGSDATVIGIFLSASAITYYSIGAKLTDYAINIVDSMADIFLPMASHFEAMGELDRLKKVFLIGNRVCALILFPIGAVMIILGKSLITVWVGPKYVSSYVILLLLFIPKALYRAQAASNRVLFGMARHRTLGVVTLIEGIVNLVLSIVLVHYWGIVGVAVGTTIPLLATDLLFMPQHLCRVLNVRLTTFLSQSYLPPLALCVPLVATLLFLKHLFPIHNYWQLLAQVATGGSVYGIGLTWLFLTREPMGIKLRARFADYIQQGFSR